jgi:23S rRNA U2552 (ribose-2'-O)-methylase RlmE/FtsJ
MIYYIIPPITYKLYSCLDLAFIETPQPLFSVSLSRFLYDIKEKIRTREKEWDIYKKYTNSFEFIHTLIQNKKRSVSKYKPLSRSYFKMVELVHELHLLPETSDPIQTFHLAEGPGGFIEAIVNLRKNPEDTYIGMTILDDVNDPNIPGWKKSEHFLYTNRNVFIERGADETGDILSLANLDHCRKMYASSMDFITADGGFDFSTDFNKQEIHISRLLFSQMVFALTMQRKNGHFVLKIFDSFHQPTIDILAILSSFYKTVYMTKPHTSRAGNSEKYVVCKDFLYDSADSFFMPFRRIFERMNDPMNVDDEHIGRFLNIPVPLYFTVKVEEYNSIFGQQQIENIHSTLSLIDKSVKSDRIDTMVKANITKCTNWCIRYNVPYNVFSTNNVFG